MPTLRSIPTVAKTPEGIAELDEYINQFGTALEECIDSLD